MKEQQYDALTIYYFSGTGNAKNTAIWIQEEACKIGLKVELFDIAENFSQQLAEPDENSLIGFISPTHGFHFPKIMRRFIKQFPKSKNCSAFVANTRAGTRIGRKTIVGLSGVLHYWSYVVLKRKGYKIVGLFPVDLPSNWISLHPAFRKAGTKIIYENSERKVRRFARELSNGGQNYRALFDIVQDMVIAPVSVLYDLFGKYFFSKSFIASSHCNNCNLCMTSCPVGAIKEVNGRKYWTLQCESCMKCMNECPRKAIETAHGFLFLVFVVTTVFLWFLSDILLEMPVLENWLWLKDRSVLFGLKSILIFPFLFIGYRLMHWLMRFSLFERLFVISSFTHYRFWGRYNLRKLRSDLDE